jgi:hypothetical protein
LGYFRVRVRVRIRVRVEDILASQAAVIVTLTLKSKP